jgi:hypothetical protein
MKISYLQPPRAQTNLNPKTQKSILRDPQLSSKARFCPPGSGLSPFSKQKKKVSLKQLPPYIIGTNKEDVQQFKTGSLMICLVFGRGRKLNICCSCINVCLETRINDCLEGFDYIHLRHCITNSITYFGRDQSILVPLSSYD